ncbi:uncharacterized protein LOC134441001 [Engraulis encrasicolus]|uniref:uncharacterized protein LOC134441001 n=1 Tax=Engraulis encrasicolus TaxID=184585 RepID=UPI002FD19BF8
MKEGSVDPFQDDPGPDGSSSPEPFPVQDYISNLSEEDWIAFSSLMNRPMTRSQFVDICQTVLKVVSSSSMGMILPAFAHMERDLECYSYTPSRSKSAGSDKTTGAPVGLGGMMRMQGALAAFHKCTAAWRCPVSALANAVRPPSMTKLRIYCAKRRPSPDLPDVVTVTRPSTVTELRVYSANCMASPDLPEVVSVPRPEGESLDPISIDRILERVLSDESIDHVAKHLVDLVLQEDRPSVTRGKCCPSSPLPEMYSYAEAAIKDLLQPYFLPLVAHGATVDSAELRPAASAAPDAVDGVQATAKVEEDAVSSQSRAPSANSSCELNMTHQPDSSGLQVHASMVSFFTDLMVNQVMDKVHLDAHAQQDDATDEPDPASAGGPDGCLTSLLMLRLLANMRDGGRSSVDKGMLQKLIDKILSEFRSGVSGVPNVRGYLNNTRIQNINRTMEEFLLKEFGSKNILWRAANLKDDSFNTTFLAKLSEVLRVEVSGAPPVLSGSTILESEPKAAGGKKGKKSTFGVKIPNRRKRSSKVSPISVAADKGQQAVTPAPSGNISAAPADKVKPGKPSWIKKLFSCCLPSETEI